jgi:hypothetical protein
VQIASGSVTVSAPKDVETRNGQEELSFERLATGNQRVTEIAFGEIGY